MATEIMLKTKKESLLALEETLKRKLSELQELCLKENELTDRLHQGDSIQSRKPDPQMRRRPLPNTSVTSNEHIIYSGLSDTYPEPTNHLPESTKSSIRPGQPERRQPFIQRPLPLAPNDHVTRTQFSRSHHEISIEHSSQHILHQGPHPSSSTSLQTHSSQTNTPHAYSSSSSSSSTSSSSIASDERRKLRQARLEQLAKSVLTQTQYEGLANLKTLQQQPTISNKRLECQQHSVERARECVGEAKSASSLVGPPDTGVIPKSLSSNVASEVSSRFIGTQATNAFQPYWEETKPYELSDFYKYSAKHRKKLDDNADAKLSRTNEHINSYTPFL